MERWAPIAGFPAYEVSSEGRVRRVLSRYMRPCAPRICKPKVDRQGYMIAEMSVGGKCHYQRISRLVLTAFVGPAPTLEHQAAHGDGNNAINQLSNLRWATPVENNADKVRHGTHVFGERIHWSRNSVDAVRRVRAMSKDGMSLPAIAAATGVPKSTAHNMIKRHSWKQVV